MATKLDRMDKQIVDLLTQDGRMSSKQIARLIDGATERVVRYRMKRLIEEDVITVSAKVNPLKVGFPVIADVFIEAEPARVMALAHALAEYENVTYVGCSTGERDISVQIVARDNRELYDFVTQEIGQLAGVRRTSTSIVPLIIKDDHHWSIPESVIEKS
jgi:Lrp/AsnC family transcriptional regulator for asnA, asnC and gidA